MSLESLTTAELMTCMVVVYLLPLHRLSNEFLKKGIGTAARAAPRCT